MMSKEIKLTQREEQVLKALQNGEFAMYMPYRGRFNPHPYYSVNTCGKCSREIKKLIKLGFVVIYLKGIDKENIQLTELGKSYKCSAEELPHVWVVDSKFSVQVRQERGILSGDTFCDDTGYKSKTTDTKRFFTGRDEAYNWAFLKQQNKIQSLKLQIAGRELHLERLRNEYEQNS